MTPIRGSGPLSCGSVGAYHGLSALFGIARWLASAPPTLHRVGGGCHMADQVRFDVSGLADLAEDLRGAGQRYSNQVPAIIKRGAQNVKKDAQQRIISQITRRYLPWYPNAITYDVTVSGGRVVAEIGPEFAKKQGAMGPGIEGGSANHAPLPHLYPAFDTEVPKTEAQLQLAAVKAVFR